MKIKKTMFMILLVVLVLTVPGPGDIARLAGKAAPVMTVVVDAGHGGPDGGAKAADGTEEADLNLAIAQAVKEEGESRGIKVIMTRDSKDGLYAEDNLGKTWRKLEDMSQRKQKIETSKADIAVTIHMNTFPADESVRGAQVFYPKSGNAEILKNSEALAENIQKSLITGLHDGSNRMQMAKENVLLLENPSIPTVLIECGFLSNREDLTRLKQDQWQSKIAQCIVDGLLEGLEI